MALTASDVDGNGRSDLVVSFTGWGTYLFMNDYQSATDAYGEITSLTPKDAQSFFDMATVAINAGDTNTALLAFTKYLELDPNSPDAAQVKAWIKQNTPKSTSTPTPSPSATK